MTADQQAIEQILRRLVGLPLWAVGRVASLVWWQFGAEILAPTKRNPERIVGEFALHVDCPWRVVQGDEVHVGSYDFFIPTDPATDRSEFDCQPRGASRLDPLLEAFCERFSNPSVVGVEVRAAGAFALHLEAALALEIFPVVSSQPTNQVEEAWRLLPFKDGRESDHFVMGNQGVE